MHEFKRLRAVAAAWLLVLLGACGGGEHAAEPARAGTAAGLRDGGPTLKPTAASRLAAASGNAPGITTEQLLRWAQLTYPTLFSDSPPIGPTEMAGTVYEGRSYFNGNMLGVRNGEAWGIGPFTGEVLTNYGRVSDYAVDVCAKLGCNTGPAVGIVDSTVKVEAPTPASISASIVPGQGAPLGPFAGSLSGSLEAMAGRTIYVIVEDPDGLVATVPGSATVAIDVAARKYRLTLWSNPLTRQGRFAGALKIYACLDAGCARRLAGTPLVLPYDVRVRSPFDLSPSTMEVTVPFGTVPPKQTVYASRTEPYKELGYWQMLRVVPDVPYGNVASYVWGMHGGYRAPLADGRVPLDVGFRLAPIGTHAGRLPVSVQSAIGQDGKWHSFASENGMADIQISYTVVPTGQALALAPASAKATYRLVNAPRQSVTDVEGVLTEGSVAVGSASYQSWPAAETDDALRSGWLRAYISSRPDRSFSLHLEATPCRETKSGTTTSVRCLKAGDYSASVGLTRSYYDPTKGSTVLAPPVIVPMMLTVTP